MLKKILIIILIIIALIVAGYFLFFSARSVKHQDVQLPWNSDNLEIKIRDMSQVPTEFFSGTSKYSQGTCQQDEECFADGCNLEVCTSDKNIVTTCEIGGGLPEKNKYACGCIKDVCGWYLK
jgi:eight-cysteine-cluster-containing protein